MKGKMDDRSNEDLVEIPPGNGYVFTVTSAEEKVSKNGNDMIELTCTVTIPDPEHPHAEGQTCRNWLMMPDPGHKHAAFMERLFREKLDALGIPWAPSEEIEVTEEMCVGQTFRARVDLSEPNESGQRFPNIADMWSADSGDIEAAEAAKAKQGEVNYDGIPF